MLRAVILDDEPRGSTLLDLKLKQLPDEITVVAVYNDPVEAITQIGEMKPDVLFLDVEMPGMSGFQFLERLPGFSFEVIFTTAYDTYTLEALRLSVVDYLLKPINEEELGHAIQRLKKRVAEKNLVPKKEKTKAISTSRLALSTSEGIYLLEKSNIIRIEAMSNYCTFFLTENKKVVVSKTLKEFESVLEDEPHFLRLNRSVIVNMDFVARYRRGNGGTIEMTDGMEIEVSPNKKDELLLHIYGNGQP